MTKTVVLAAFRLLPIVFLSIGGVAYMAHVEGPRGYVFRNALPVVAVVALSAVTLVKGRGYWTGAGWRWPLGTLGFAIPALGLSLYLHHGYAVDMHGMFSRSLYPLEVFRFLPLYTAFAGLIGFAIGWIAGKNV